jgi:hypothetical protein
LVQVQARWHVPYFQTAHAAKGKGGIVMGQAFGSIRGADGSIDSGSGNFRVVRNEPGQYTITLDGASASDPVVVVSPLSAYSTATARVAGTTSGNPLTFSIRTGYTDQGSTNTSDCDYINFVAFWV